MCAKTQDDPLLRVAVWSTLLHTAFLMVCKYVPYNIMLKLSDIQQFLVSSEDNCAL